MVDHVGPPALRERAQEVAEADVAGGEAVQFDVGNEIVQDRGAVRGGREPHDERHGVGALGACRVLVRVGFEECVVEGVLDVLRLLSEGHGVVVAAQQLGCLGERERVLVVKRGARHAVRGELRVTWFAGTNVVPVAQSEGNDVTLGAAGEVGDVAHHLIVVAAKELEIARELVLLPRDLQKRAAPFGGVSEHGIEDDEFRRGGGDHAVVQLRLSHVVHGFGKELVEAEVVPERGAVEMRLLQPAEALAVWAVRHVAPHVAALRPVDQRVGFVEQIVGARELTHGLAYRMHNHILQRLHRRQR